MVTKIAKGKSTSKQTRIQICKISPAHEFLRQFRNSSWKFLSVANFPHFHRPRCYRLSVDDNILFVPSGSTTKYSTKFNPHVARFKLRTNKFPLLTPTSRLAEVEKCNSLSFEHFTLRKIFATLHHVRWFVWYSPSYDSWTEPSWNGLNS